MYKIIAESNGVLQNMCLNLLGLNTIEINNGVFNTHSQIFATKEKAYSFLRHCKQIQIDNDFIKSSAFRFNSTHGNFAELQFRIIKL